MSVQGLDILHPSTSLEWVEWPPLPVRMNSAQSVWLNGAVYAGGGYSGYLSAAASLYSLKPGVDSEWTVTDTPTYQYALAVYNSELLLVGGIEYPTREITNKVLTMRDGEFFESLPLMNEKRSSPSAITNGSALVVAGGHGTSGELSSVEVLKDGQWTTAPSLPRPGYHMSFALHGGQWYIVNIGRSVFRVSLQSLTSGTDLLPWKTLPDAPNSYSAAVFFGGHLLSIGGAYGKPTTAIHAFSSSSQSWEHVADLPVPLIDSSAVVLPTGELVVIGGISIEGKYNMAVFAALLKAPLVDNNVTFSHMGLGHLVEWIAKCVTGSLPEREDSPQPSELGSPGDKEQVKRLLVQKESLEAELDVLTDEYYKQLDTIEELEKENDHLRKENHHLRAESKQFPPVKGEVKEPVKPEIKIEPGYQDVPSPPHLPSGVKSEPQETTHSLNLAGVEVVASTSVVLTNSFTTFNWAGHGFRLTVPLDSLPAGVDQCQLDIVASTAGQYQFPDNLQLVSGVFWVRPGAPGPFRQQLIVEIQHCAKMTSSTKLLFVRAHCFQESLPYKFNQVKGGDSFTEHSSYGSLEVTHFSAHAIAAEGPVDLLYVASLYYFKSNLQTIDIYFTISQDESTHNTERNNHFEHLGAKEQLNLEVEFEESDISLDIPLENGVVVNEWSLLPLTFLKISKRRVDSFKPGRTLPSVKLVATLSESCLDLKVPKRSHLTTLLGAKEPDNRMRIVLDPVDLNNRPSNTTGGKWSHTLNTAGSTSGSINERGSNKLTIQDLDEVFCTLINAADKWYSLGLALGISVFQLKGFKSSQKDDQACLCEMLTYWLQWSSCPTWTDISTGLRKTTVEKINLAKSIEDKYYNRESQLPSPTGTKKEATSEHSEQGPSKRPRSD